MGPVQRSSVEMLNVVTLSLENLRPHALLLILYSENLKCNVNSLFVPLMVYMYRFFHCNEWFKIFFH